MEKNEHNLHRMKSNTPSASYSLSNIQELGYSITTSFYWKYCEKHKLLPK